MIGRRFVFFQKKSHYIGCTVFSFGLIFGILKDIYNRFFAFRKIIFIPDIEENK